MRRSQIIAARSRNTITTANSPQSTSGETKENQPSTRNISNGPSTPSSSSSLPPFVHKSHAPPTPPAVPSALASSSGASVGGFSLPKWNLDISKKATQREERNAKARRETEIRRARREDRPPNLTLEEIAEADESRHHDFSLDDPPTMDMSDGDACAPLMDDEDAPVAISAAKRDFLAKAAPGSIKSALAPEPIAAASTFAQPAPTPTPTPPALPPFSPAKRLFNNIPKGSGISPRKSTAASSSTTNSAAEKPERYFNCSFAARSTKKHKNYEDGVLIVCGRRCTLKNMSAQTLSCSLVSQSTDKFEVGCTYTIASHEIELGNPLPSEEYLSGRIFVGTTYSMKAGETTNLESSSLSETLKRGKTGHALFNKQRVANKPQRNPMDELAQRLTDPDLLLLNEEQLISRGERPVDVDLFLSKQLRQHQREGVKFMYDCVMGIRSQGYEGCILADSMGLGKTLQAITLLYTLLHKSPTSKKGVVSKVLVVCPATLVSNWNKEFIKWLGSHRCKPLVLLANMKQVDQQQMVHDFVRSLVSNVMIVGYELLRKHVKELRELPNAMLVCDEGHRLKSTSVNQTIKALLAIPTKKRIMLTGTPVQNDLGEFYAMSDFVNPSILGNLTTFSRTFMQPINRSRDTSASQKEKELGEYRSKELAQRTQNFVLRRTNEILLQYLPEKIEQILFIPLTPFQAEIYRGLLRGKAIRQVLARTHGSGQDALALQAINSLKKLCNHPGLVYEEAKEYAGNEPKSAYSYYPDNYVAQSNFSDVTQSSKLAVLDHLLAAVRKEGQKIVLVSNYIQTLDMLAVYLRNKNYQFLRLDGQTPASERQTLVDRFNATYASYAFVFLLSAKAGGLGLNLIGGNRLILFDPDWNPACDLQAMSRVWRDGQKQTVYIYRFLCTATIDEKIHQRQIRKTELSLSVMHDQSESVIRNFDTKSLKEVFTYRDDTNCETRDILARTKKQLEDDEVIQALSDFHEDLSQALDPLLKSIPRHLVSAFENRVCSVEENRRSLELMAERQRKKLERAAAKKSQQDAADVDALLEDDEDGDDTEEKKEDATNTSPPATDDDDGEAEYDFAPSTAVSVPRPATAATSSTDGFGVISAEEEAIAAEMDVDDDQDLPPIRSSSGSKGQKRRRHLTDLDDEDQKDQLAPNPSETTNTPQTPSKRPTLHGNIDPTSPDWMKPSSQHAAASPVRLSSLDSAACAIVPPPKEPETVTMEYTLDTISTSTKKPKVKLSVSKHIEDDDD